MGIIVAITLSVIAVAIYLDRCEKQMANETHWTDIIYR